MLNPAQVGWIQWLYFMETIVHLDLLMAILKTTNGLKKGPSRRPLILQRGKTVFIGRVEMRKTQISAGFMSVINIKNGLLYDFNEFDFFFDPATCRWGFSLECGDLFFWVFLLLSLAWVGSFCQFSRCAASAVEPQTDPVIFRWRGFR